jgi:hypothetical protein
MKERRQQSRDFGAPWGWQLKVTTILAVIFVVAVAIISPFVLPRKMLGVAFVSPSVCLATLGISALFCVRGYAVRYGELWIQRSFWQTRLTLNDLERAYADSQAMKGTTQKVGISGFMGHIGWFRNKRLGNYRAFVTDPGRCVVLEFSKRKVVVSPDNPAAFVQALGFDTNSQEDSD